MDRRAFLGIGLAAGSGAWGLSQWITTAESLPNAPEKMPAVFVGHGSPMNAIENNEFSQGWRVFANQIPKPKAIVCISAHWLTRGTALTAMEKPETIHDFGGFPDELFRVKYPAPGYPELATEIQKTLKPNELTLDYEWGLDHGSWSVIKQMYPEADIPVIQMSIDYAQNPEFHYKLGKLLSFLREKGVLVLGSGNIIHNLNIIDFRKQGGYDWAEELNPKITEHLLHNNHQYFIQYKNIGKSATLAIPSPDHFYPLLYILGMQNAKDSVALFNNKLVMGSISMTSVVIS